jgi:hypoxanthine phosphoribosyltransferase
MVSGLLKERRPASLRTAVLLRKDRPEAMAFPVDYVCFDIPDHFVVGYGLDYNDYYRNLPDVVTLRREVTANS